MNEEMATETVAATTDEALALPANFLNCYEISDPSMLAWPVSVYLVRRIDKKPQTHEDRGAIKNVIWTVRKRYATRCPGLGFVIDLNDLTVAVPAAWNLPVPISVEGYEVTIDRSFMTDRNEPKDSQLIAGIIRDGVKNHFKNNHSNKLGYLWQDYNDFCQMPEQSPGEEFIFCRRFGLAAKVLRGKKWVIRFLISTATLDGKSLNNYYLEGEVEKLAGMIEAKRVNRLTRSGRPTAVRVWCNESTQSQTKARVLELDEPSIIAGHKILSRREQRSLANGTVRCRVFNGTPVDLPLNQIRLILDTQITQEEHGDTIIEPQERQKFVENLRNFVSGAKIYGHSLHLAQTALNIDHFPTIFVTPPVIRVRGENGFEKLIEAPVNVSPSILARRSRERWDHIRRFGFLQQRPINPLLACPKFMGENRARRMRRDLEYIWSLQGIEYRFGLFLYRDVEDIRKEVEHHGYDALLTVLPEDSRTPHGLDDTHEKIKRRMDVPSQCIKHDRTLPEAWVEKKPREFKQAEPKLAHRVQQNYESCLLNLLVKHHWVPFAPAEAFFYNVHVGLDVGGRNNNKAMACLGYGFRKPREGLIFRPEEIPIDVQKAEPIPTDCLYRGLLELFEYIHKELISMDIQPDFERTIFYRDGQLLGDGDSWNEKDALHRLHGNLLDRNWITSESLWTAVEILKEAEGWRLLRNGGRIMNPLVGHCVFPYEEENTAILTTTGTPYLPQGTACPLMVRLLNIHGCANREEVVRDLVWQADMCFTKPDIGMRLPWVLHVADTGALQLSRSYHITGITV